MPGHGNRNISGYVSVDQTTETRFKPSQVGEGIALIQKSRLRTPDETGRATLPIRTGLLQLCSASSSGVNNRRFLPVTQVVMETRRV